MKILVVTGSSHARGNTEQLADAFIRGARENGHDVNLISMSKLHVNFCFGCNACEVHGECIQKDDMQEIYHAFQECDLFVMASPLYFWGLSAQIKTVIDRLYALREKNQKGYYKYPEKQCMLLMTAADSDSHFWTFEVAEQYYLRLVSYMRWTNLGMLKAGSCGGTVQERRIDKTKYLAEAYRMGKSI